MRRSFAVSAEVLGRRDEPDPKVLLPETIDDDARRERMVFMQEPSRERQAIGRRGRRQRRQHAGCVGLHDRSALIVLAAYQEMHVSRFALLLQNERTGELA